MLHVIFTLEPWLTEQPLPETVTRAENNLRKGISAALLTRVKVSHMALPKVNRVGLATKH